jgi:hypothetical protein
MRRSLLGASVRSAVRMVVPGGVALASLAACGRETPAAASRLTTGPTPSPSQVVPGSATGPTRIVFVSADPPLGTTISGCGQDATGCPGRVRMVFRLIPAATGTALRFVVALNATSKRACFLASTGPLPLRVQEAQSFQVVLDPYDTCAVPFAIRDMSANVEGPVELASRQEWAVGYTFAP